MELKQLPEDFIEFINFLNENNVQYLLLGGWAVGIYGNPRATKDIEFIVGTDDENLKKLAQALKAFGILDIDLHNFKKPNYIFRIGISPIQIDILNDASGINFDDCCLRKKTILLDSIPISVLSKKDLIKNKKASGRFQDLADIENLDYN